MKKTALLLSCVFSTFTVGCDTQSHLGSVNPEGGGESSLSEAGNTDGAELPTEAPATTSRCMRSQGGGDSVHENYSQFRHLGQWTGAPGLHLANNALAKLCPGDSVAFNAWASDTEGLGEIVVVNPEGAAKVLQTIRKKRLAPAGSDLMEYYFIVPGDVEAGTRVELRALGVPGSQENPGWAFTFYIDVIAG